MGERAEPMALVVEGDRSSARLVEVLLREVSLAVTTVASAEEALRLLDLYTPTLMTTELTLPGMGGLELVRCVRAKPRLQGVRVVAVTSQRDPGSLRLVKLLGFDGWIRKPIDVNVFVDRTRSLLQPAVE